MTTTDRDTNVRERTLTPDEHLCYVQWLGIPKEECPPNHYRLLNIVPLENDPAIIQQAYHGRLAEVAVMATQADAATALQLKKLLGKVLAVLSDSVHKQIYDGNLAPKLAAAPTSHPKPSTTWKQQPNRAQPSESSGRPDSAERPERPALPAKPDAVPQPSVAAGQRDQGMPPQLLEGSSNWARFQPYLLPGLATSLLVNVLLLGLLGGMAMRRTPEMAATQIENRPSQASPAGADGLAMVPPVPGDTFEVGGGFDALSTNVDRTSELASVVDQVSSTPAKRSESSTVAPSLASSVLPSNRSFNPNPDPGVNAVASPDDSSFPNLARSNESSVSKAWPAPTQPRETPKQAIQPTITEPRKVASSQVTPSGPFAELAHEFALPDLPRSVGDVSASSSPGKLGIAAINDLSLSLDHSLADLSERYAFRLERVDAASNDSRRWKVLVDSIDASGVATGSKPTQLGYFLVDELGQLRYFWEFSDAFPKADQLANAVLAIKANESTHLVQLRSAEHVERQFATLTGRMATEELSLSSLPPKENLRLKVLFQYDRSSDAVASRSIIAKPDWQGPPSPTDADVNIDGNRDLVGGPMAALGVGAPRAVSMSPETELVAPNDSPSGKNELSATDEIPFGETKRIDITKDGSIRLVVELNEDNDQNLIFKVGSEIRVSTTPQERYSLQSWDKLQTDVQHHGRSITKSFYELNAAIKTLSACTAELPGRVQTRNQLHSQFIANPKSGATLRPKITELNSRIMVLELNIKRATSTRNRNWKSIPKSYANLAEKLKVLRIAGRLQNLGEYEYHLIANSSSGPLRLLMADGQPATQRHLVEIPPFQLTGNWFRFDQGLVYQLSGDNSGGSANVRGAFPGDSRSLSGRWTSDGEQLSIETTSGTEVYQLEEDIMMTSSTTTLHRLFN